MGEWRREEGVQSEGQILLSGTSPRISVLIPIIVIVHDTTFCYEINEMRQGRETEGRGGGGQMRGDSEGGKLQKTGMGVNWRRQGEREP